MSRSIATRKHVWKYYIKLPNFEAQCVFCEKKYCYVHFANFKNHVVTHHRKIWKYEENRKLIKWPWIYFKYLNKLYSQCIICNANVLSTSKSVKCHLNSHFEAQRKNYTYQDWLWKYWTSKDDLVVECNICHMNISLYMKSWLDSHIRLKHPDKLKNIQKTHNTIDSSERVSSLEPDTVSISQNMANKILLLKDCYVLLTRCPPYNLYI